MTNAPACDVTAASPGRDQPAHRPAPALNVIEGAIATLRALPDAWFDHEHSDTEVLTALFGSGWTMSLMPMLRGLSTRFWFLERPARIVQVSLARDHNLEPYQKGEGPLPERRLWSRAHLRAWLYRSNDFPDWADLMAAEIPSIDGTGRPTTPRAAPFFAHWAHLHVPDPAERAALLVLAGLTHYTNAPDLIGQHETTATR